MRSHRRYILICATACGVLFARSTTAFAQADPAGYIITNQHVVERAADLKIHVTTNDGKTYNAHYITGDDKTDLAFIKIDAKAAFPFVSLDNISPNLLGETVIVVGNAVGYGS